MRCILHIILQTNSKYLCLLGRVCALLYSSSFVFIHLNLSSHPSSKFDQKITGLKPWTTLYESHLKSLPVHLLDSLLRTAILKIKIREYFFLWFFLCLDLLLPRTKLPDLKVLLLCWKKYNSDCTGVFL